MSIYARFKKNPEGFRQLVELLESSPLSKRQKMIDAGMREDATYTEKALALMMNFDDVCRLPDMELAELLAAAPALAVGMAVSRSEDSLKQRFLSKSPTKAGSEVKAIFEQADISPAQILGAQMKLITTARKLEKKGYIKTKRIPTKPS
jgi:flagellar motor switch protein FliG